MNRLWIDWLKKGTFNTTFTISTTRQNTWTSSETVIQLKPYSKNSTLNLHVWIVSWNKDKSKSLKGSLQHQKTFHFTKDIKPNRFPTIHNLPIMVSFIAEKILNDKVLPRITSKRSNKTSKTLTNTDKLREWSVRKIKINKTRHFSDRLICLPSTIDHSVPLNLKTQSKVD